MDRRAVFPPPLVSQTFAIHTSCHVFQSATEVANGTKGSPPRIHDAEAIYINLGESLYRLPKLLGTSKLMEKIT